MFDLVLFDQKPFSYVGCVSSMVYCKLQFSSVFTGKLISSGQLTWCTWRNRGPNKLRRDRAFSVAAKKMWNKLPLLIIQSSSLSIFKTRLKTYFWLTQHETLFLRLWFVLLFIFYVVFVVINKLNSISFIILHFCCFYTILTLLGMYSTLRQLGLC